MARHVFTLGSDVLGNIVGQMNRDFYNSLLQSCLPPA
jgi:hypothetical protein